MITRRTNACCSSVIIGILLFATSGFIVARAEVTADNSPQGNLGTMVTPGPNFDITGGTRNGANLYHGFESFSLESSEVANFINDSGLPTKNILSRVTGGDPSNIFGTIQTTGFAVDGVTPSLWLMNPAGILFGSTAQLNVEGSFHATTADYIRIGNEGGIFYANPSQTSVLSVAEPSAFGFLNANPAPIDVQAGSFDFDTSEFKPLKVPEGETISFVGGTLNLGAAEVRNETGDEVIQDAQPTYILAPGGQINLVSVASPGEATIDTSIEVDSFSQLGEININGGDIFGGALMFPTYIDSKNISIRGGQLVIDNALLWPAFFSGFGLAPPADGGGIDIAVNGSVNITGTDVEPFLGNAPGIFTLTGTLSSPPELLPEAKGPDVKIEADSLTISGAAAIQTLRAGPGDPSNITVNTDSVTVENGGSISMVNFFAGSGGVLAVNTRELNLSGDGSPSPTGNTGLTATNFFHPCFGCESFDPRLTLADAGSIIVNATDSVNVAGDAVIVTDSPALGRGGDITIDTGNLSVTGTGPFTAGIFAQTAISGDAGNITIKANGTITLKNGARIAGNTFGAGQGSNVAVNAGKSITLSGTDSRITNATGPLSLDELNSLFGSQLGFTFSELLDMFGLPTDASLFELLDALNEAGIFMVPETTPGDAGITLVNTPELTLNTDTRVEVSTGWDANAGTFEANVGSLFLNDGGAINSRSGIETLDGELLLGIGNAGAVNVSATDTISIAGSGSTISTNTFGGGAGGSIALTGNKIQILNDGSVTADSSGTGLAGDITIAAGNKIDMNGGTISTRAVTSDGGNIELTAPEWVYLLNSDITTSVESGLGGGGNITIDPQFVILNQSNILANAFGGPGGNITIVADNLISSAQSSIDASSALGINGTVNISNPDQEVAQELAVLPENFLDVTGLISDRCGTTAGASSLVSAGPGGLAIDPDGYLPSFGALTNAAYNGDGGSSAINSGKTWWALALDTSALQLAQVTCTR